MTPEEALTHPTWRMGEKITVDSATLMNKALEVIEARWLFDLAPSQINVVIHPESIVHSMVEFRDGSVVAQLAVPDMRIPIRYALTHPERVRALESTLDVTRMENLHFRQATVEEFPALRLAYEALEKGGTSAAVLNAANEVAVAQFLQRRIRFPQILEAAGAVLEKHSVKQTPSLADLMEADIWARKEALRWLSCKT